MTGREPYVLGPGEGYTGMPAQPPKPATGRRRAHLARAAREVLAAIGPPCATCRCGPRVHQHLTGGTHCALHPDTCPSYRKASP